MAMSQQNSTKAAVTFCDVAAYFSEEEWKLLHDWQKEIYDNVMKEIQQALLSLGPVIAATVFSLKAKEREDAFSADSDVTENHAEHYHSDNITSVYKWFRMKRHGNRKGKYTPYTDNNDSNDSCVKSKGDNIAGFDPFRISTK